MAGVVGEAVIGNVHPFVVSIEGVEALDQQLELEALVGEERAGEAKVGGGVVGTGEAVAGKAGKPIAICISVPIRIAENVRVEWTTASGPSAGPR